MAVGKVTQMLIFLCAAGIATAQDERELIKDVDPAYAALLEQYNWVEVADATYFASRHRIVTANIDLLREAEDIVVTPFEDVSPIRLIADSVTVNSADNFYWTGRYDFPVEIPILISVLAWDLDNSGNATASLQNRFEFSPLWAFDDFDNPTLELPQLRNQGAGVIRDPGPPPQTPEQVERHKWLHSLDKRAFFSATTVIDVPGRRSKYVLSPLRFTPKYSILYEISRDTFIPVVIDLMPGQELPWNDEQKRIAAEYQSFRSSLPLTEQKPVRGDLP